MTEVAPPQNSQLQALAVQMMQTNTKSQLSPKLNRVNSESFNPNETSNKAKVVQ